MADGKRDTMQDGLDYNANTGTYRTTFSIHDTQPSTAVLQAIARLEDVEPTALDSLHPTVDPDALNRLMLSGLRGQDGDVRVSVSIGGYRATIHSYGIIKLDPLNSED